MKETQMIVKNNVSEITKRNGKPMAIGGFALVALVLILIAVFGLNEFVVSVCVLLILEAGMAVCLHKAELWKHGVMLAAQIAAGIIIGRVSLVIICIIAYVAATAALQIITKNENQS